ncbi:DUF7144 family membrane protein [Micromonospora sp. WMMA1923]|uniref:DUF7144 family membrane protein n=1 Tax=Micromonospora sp. WMMA1923 TaxID=3404125 RepID=UPI003B93E7E9
MDRRASTGVRTGSTPNRRERPLLLAGILLGTAALFDVLIAIDDLGTDRYVSLTEQGLVRHDVTGWAWLHLAVGVLLGVAGLVAPLGRVWSTRLGLAAATLGIGVHLVIGPFHPVQALITAGLAVAAARLLLRHGRWRRRAERVSSVGRPSR